MEIRIIEIEMRKHFVKLLLIAILGITVFAQTTVKPTTSQPLKIGQKLEREINGGKVDNYSLKLKKGEFVQIEILQNGIDVAVKVFNSNNQSLIERDAPNGTHGAENISFIAQSNNIFRVQIKPTDEKAKVGNYTIELKAERQPRENDLLRIKTEQAFADLIKLRDQQTPESIKAMQPKLEEALAGWRKFKEKYWESITLELFAGFYLRTGNGDKSLEMLKLALLTARESGDNFRSASVLQSYGDIYFELKKIENAIDFYTQAADFAHSKQDFESEIIALQSVANVYANEKKFAKSIESFEKAFKLFEQQKNQTGEAQTLNQIGVQYSNLDNRKKALDYYERAIKLSHNLNDARIESLALTNAGYDFYTDDKIDKSLEYHQRAFDVRKNAKLDDVAVESLVEISAIYKQQHNTSEYIKSKEQLIDFYQKNNQRKEVANTLNDIGLAWSQLKESQKAINYYTDSIKVFHEIADKSNEAAALYNLGYEFYKLGNWAKAIELINQAIELRQGLKEFQKVGDSYKSLATIYDKSGDFEKSIAAFEESIANYRQINDEKSIAEILNLIGVTYSERYKKQKTDEIDKKTVENFEQGLTLARAQKNEYLEARILTNLAIHLSDSKQFQKALELFQTVLPIWQKQNSATDQSSVWQGMGDALQDLNQDKKAIEAYFTALEFQKTLNERDKLAMIYNNLGVCYENLENFQEAVKYYRLSLQLNIENKNREGEMRADGNLSKIFQILGDLSNASDFAAKRWELAEKTTNYEEQVDALIAMAEIANALREKQMATNFLAKAWEITDKHKVSLKFSLALNLGLIMLKEDNDAEEKDLVGKMFGVALKKAQKDGELLNQINALQALALMNYKYKDYAKTLEYMQQAFPLVQSSGNLRFQAAVLGNFMVLLQKQGNIRPAILYGKQAVNNLQKIRYSIKDLDTDLQKSFLTSNENTYRLLADLLIAEGRLPEAQQVLDLLKEEEFSEFVRRDGNESNALAKNVSLTETERKALTEYSKLSDDLTLIGSHFQELQTKRDKSGGHLTNTDETEYQTLKTQVETANEGLRKFLQAQIVEFSKKVEDDAIITPQSIETLRADLRRAGSDVVLVSTYLLPERYRAIVTTGRTMVDRKVEYKDLKLSTTDIKLSGEEINKKILAFQQILQNPKLDPRPLGKELYDIFVKPIEKDLQGAKAKTILWSLDGSLRYIPIAALSPDGKTYLAEKYQNEEIQFKTLKGEYDTLTKNYHSVKKTNVKLYFYILLISLDSNSR